MPDIAAGFDEIALDDGRSAAIKADSRLCFCYKTDTDRRKII